MLKSLLVSALLFGAAHLVAQTEANPKVRSPWLFIEGHYQVLRPLVRAGQNYTRAEISDGMSVRILARQQLSPWLSLAGGVGFTSRQFEQLSRYDEVIQFNPPGIPDRQPDYVVRSGYSDLAVSLPVDLRAELFRIGPGKVYLRGGGGWLISFGGDHSNYRVPDNGGDPALQPEGSVTSPSASFIQGALGFVVRETTGHQWYLQLAFYQTTSDVIQSALPDPFDQPRTYLRSMRYQSFGIGGGLGF